VALNLKSQQNMLLNYLEQNRFLYRYICLQKFDG